MTISEEQYERLMLMVFFETLTIVLFITWFPNLTFIMEKAVFWYIAFVFQMPFLSFIQYDWIGRRPSLVEKGVRFLIHGSIVMVVLGLFVLIFAIDVKSGIVGTLLTVVFMIIGNWKKISSWFVNPKTRIKK